MEVRDLNWRKATYSNGGENCVEVANVDGVTVRDTVDRQGPMLTFSAEAWRTFVDRLK
jgi:hypothetical protein